MPKAVLGLQPADGVRNAGNGRSTQRGKMEGVRSSDPGLGTPFRGAIGNTEVKMDIKVRARARTVAITTTVRKRNRPMLKGKIGPDGDLNKKRTTT